MSLMVMPASKLPDDVDTLKAMVLAMAERADALQTEVADLKALKASADERIARLTSILKALERYKPSPIRHVFALLYTNWSAPLE